MSRHYRSILSIQIAYAYLYGVVAFQGGFSLWKLNDTYTGYCIRVRRTSDNVEQEIGFSGNFLDIGSLLSFAGANNCRVVKWYSQDGSGLYASQTTANSQPLIVDTGAMVQNPEGDYSLDFLVGGTQRSLLVFSSGAMYNNKSFAMGTCVVSDLSNLRRDIAAFCTTAGGTFRFGMTRSFTTAYRTELRTRRLDANAVTSLISSTNFAVGKVLHTFIMDYANADSFIRDNGVQVATSTSHGTSGSTSATDSNITMATDGSSGIGQVSNAQSPKYISEVVFYNTNVMANVADIESNINTRHNAY